MLDMLQMCCPQEKQRGNNVFRRKSRRELNRGILSVRDILPCIVEDNILNERGYECCSIDQERRARFNYELWDGQAMQYLPR